MSAFLSSSVSRRDDKDAPKPPPNVWLSKYARSAGSVCVPMDTSTRFRSFEVTAPMGVEPFLKLFIHASGDLASPVAPKRYEAIRCRFCSCVVETCWDVPSLCLSHLSRSMASEVEDRISSDACSVAVYPESAPVLRRVLKDLRSMWKNPFSSSSETGGVSFLLIWARVSSIAPPRPSLSASGLRSTTMSRSMPCRHCWNVGGSGNTSTSSGSSTNVSVMDNDSAE
mmetsp:Transcript_10671/g.29590  ORF Transcript_10671/g.29590 Transcript_10671/m.29590 type:complete len:226 (+) Transcript_10671:1327-2004(+)